LFRQGIDFFQAHYREGLFGVLSGILGQWSIVPVLGLAGLIVGWLRACFVGEERRAATRPCMRATF
jgi:hypothetical protein